MTGEQKEQINNFISHKEAVMTLQQGQAVVAVLLECHEMLEELTGRKVLKRRAAAVAGKYADQQTTKKKEESALEYGA